MASNASFTSRLTQRAFAADSLLCIGLDPHPEFLSTPTAAAAREFCLRIIDTTADLACAFKPNSAFFEAFGPGGLQALRDVIAAVPPEIPVILDVKRGDIASTAQAYARAAFDLLGASAVTLSPYLGVDALEPFLEDPARGAFVLCKTSNPGADALQALVVDGEPLFLHLARLASSWNRRDNLGLVVGATDPEALAAVREAVPDMWLLVPGVGDQGGDLETALRAGLRQDGLGVLISVSRAVARAEDPRLEAARLQGAINQVRRAITTARGAVGLHPGLARLADELLDAGCVRFGEFTLKSGLKSPIYFDLRLLAGRPRLLSRVAAAYRPSLATLTFDRLAALPYAGLPIGTALALQTGLPLVYPRKEVKGYGTRAVVEGGFEPGETVVLIDDLATTGGSKFEAIERLTAAGLVVRDVVVLIDRQSGAREDLAAEGFQLHAVFTLGQLLAHWKAVGRLSEGDVEAVWKSLNSG